MGIVVAESLDVPPVANPSKRQIELVHRRYMTLLHEAFEECKAESGHPTDQITFMPSIDLLGEERYSAEWLAAVADAATNLPMPLAQRKESNTTEAALVLVASLAMLGSLVWIGGAI